LCWPPVMDKGDAIKVLEEAGIEPPLLTRLGFPHANCGGGCVKAGAKQFRHLLKMLPDEFARWETEEQGIREYLDKDVAILRDRRMVERPVTECPHVMADYALGDEDDGRTYRQHAVEECPEPITVTRKVPNTAPLTLRALRERVEEDAKAFDDADWGGCGCFSPDGADDNTDELAIASTEIQQ
jgi:hypothetical protein